MNGGVNWDPSGCEGVRSLCAASQARSSTQPLTWFLLVLSYCMTFGIPSTRGQGLGITDNNSLSMPSIGSSGLRVLTPYYLEVTLIGSRPPDPSGQETLSTEAYAAAAPQPSEFIVKVNGASVPVSRISFKRRVLYAPLNERDLRIANCLYLELSLPIKPNQSVEVLNPNGSLWPATAKMTSSAKTYRFNPAIHVNQVGYLPTLPKIANVG